MGELKPCDQEIYRNGDVVGIYAANIGAVAFERVVQGVATILEIDLDWHFAGGRAVVKCRPDEDCGSAGVIEAVLIALGNYDMTRMLRLESTVHDDQEMK